ncbi:FAD-binding oxidoreductase [Gordonia sp. PDNC005]|uniref:FAD-binding oxidoreductase n=1 Tax=unclassified Gordonia (in: high G+C Gram-positive bacteria) TaxID=2657482 RepID=UPI001963096E|nr:FAD-binding protein [Gordonia sp. PDNC005]QRY61130.1 FAD-binding oxidoreductase [Gordonia sp. PDNC005]
MTTESTRSIDRADIASLRAAVRGDVHRPADPAYETISFNATVSRHPWAVIDVVDADDVAAVVAFAADNGMTVAVHATGHGATPIGGDTLLVRTGGLAGLHVDASARTARVGAGLRWQAVIDAAAPLGLAPVCGSAPSVGVVGLLTGAGIGPMVRALGSSADYVREFTVVTGDASIRRAAPDENAELYWGLRGGKGTLGIVVDALIDLLPIRGFYGGALYFDGDHADAVLHAWNAWIDTLPDDADTSVALLRLPDMPGVPPMLAGRLTVAVRFVSLADPATAASILAPMRDVAVPLLDAVSPLPYAAIGAVHADPADPMPVFEDSVLLGEVTPNTIAALLEQAGPAAHCPLLMVEMRLLGGALSRPSEHPSALCHRAAAANLQIVGVLVPPIADLVPEAVGSLLQALASFSDGSRLPNFTAASDPSVIGRCYDDDTRAWLIALAGQYDPAGVLAVGQVVR